ncbi:MAG: hypothetical protein ACLUD0_00275 [Eubacterium ramulus]
MPKVKKILTTGFSALRIIPSLCGVGYSDSDYGRWCETGFDSVGYSGNPTNPDPDDTGFFTGSGILCWKWRVPWEWDKREKFRQVEVPLAMPEHYQWYPHGDVRRLLQVATLAAYIGAGGLGILIA